MPHWCVLAVNGDMCCHQARRLLHRVTMLQKTARDGASPNEKAFVMPLLGSHLLRPCYQSKSHSRGQSRHGRGLTEGVDTGGVWPVSTITITIFDLSWDSQSRTWALVHVCLLSAAILQDHDVLLQTEDLTTCTIKDVDWWFLRSFLLWRFDTNS